MSKSIVFKKAFSYAKSIVFFYQQITTERKEYILSKLLRCSTSIGANISEANGAISNNDFSAKISIAYKECLESKYWIRLLYETGYMDQSTSMNLMEKSEEIARMLFSILRTTGRTKQ